MENSGDIDSSHQIVRHPSYKPTNRSSWFDLRVFYIRISNVFINDSTPDCLTVNHIPQSPETHLEVNGVRCGMHSEGISSQLRRDRVDKKSEEATFVSTDSIRLNGSVKFEIFYKEEIVLLGVLEMISNNNGYSSAKRWNMDCEPVMTVGGSGKQELLVPTLEVYIAGSFSGTPVILTKTVHLNVRKKNNRRKALLDSIPEYEDDKHIHESRHDHLQLLFCRLENMEDINRKAKKKEKEKNTEVYTGEEQITWKVKMASFHGSMQGLELELV